MKVYLDHAATTPVDRTVLEAMIPYLQETFGNPSSTHSYGQEARIAVENARRKIARGLGAQPGEILFTSGGTESDNWAIREVLKKKREQGRHIITTPVEHKAVLNPLEDMKKEGYEVSYLSVDRSGRPDPEELESLIREDTVLVSCQWVNNELGTILPVEALGGICRRHNVLFHTDAVQALGKIPMDLSQMPVDLMSFSAHKIYGPKGTGGLYIRSGVDLPPLIQGGPQEREKRAGTENVAGIVGLAAAFELFQERREEYDWKLRDISSHFLKQIEEIPDLYFNNVIDDSVSLPGYINIRIDGVEAESLMVLLDMNGIAVSAGSACASGSLEPSHVLTAIGLGTEQARGSVRITLGHENTYEELDHAADQLKRNVERLREIRGYSRS